MNKIEKEILSFLQFKDKMQGIIKSTPSNYLSMNNENFKTKHPKVIGELKYWYKRIKLVDLKINGCGNCVLDAFIQLRHYKLNEIVNKMELLHKLKRTKLYEKLEIKDGKRVKAYYCNESPHLTNEICEEIYNKYGAAWFETYDTKWRDKVITVNIPQVEEKITTETLKTYFDLDNSVVTPEIKEQIETIEDLNELTDSVSEFEKMTHKELKTFAKDNKIPLKSNKKADIIKILQKWS